MANNDRLLAVMADITANPDGHAQEYFHRENECGTTECFAGRAISMFGDPDAKWDATVNMGDGDIAAWAVTMPWGERVDAVEYAGELLDLTTRQADALFFYMAGTENVVARAQEIIDGVIV